ncbi:MAG: 3-oxoadipate enol-lactonase [Pseudomonadota bacterium]
MTELFFEYQGQRLHYRVDGPETGPSLVFANSLGTDLTLWDDVISHLPDGFRILRMDKRGHGKSDIPPAPYAMGMLIGDFESLMDHLGLRDVVFVGLSIGGMIAQGLATKRLDLVRALVLSNTGAKIGTAEMWQTRIDQLRSSGLEPMVETILDRWFGRSFRHSTSEDRWRKMLLATPLEGYMGCCYAIKGTDFFSPTSGLRLPTLAIAGSEDNATPPDMVRELGDLIPGSDFELIRGAGHLPCAEKPELYAQTLTRFLTKIGHIP